MCAFSKIGADWARIGRGLSAFANLDMRRARVGCVLGVELANSCFKGMFYLLFKVIVRKF